MSIRIRWKTVIIFDEFFFGEIVLTKFSIKIHLPFCSGITGSHAFPYSAFLESRFQAIPDASDFASAQEAGIIAKRNIPCNLIFLYSGIKLNREHFRPSIFFEESSRIITSFKTQLQIQANPSRFNFLSHVIRLFCQRHLRCFHSSILKYFFNYRGSNFLTNVTDTLTNLPCTPKTTTFISFLFFVPWTSTSHSRTLLFMFLASMCLMNFLQHLTLLRPFNPMHYFCVSNSFH